MTISLWRLSHLWLAIVSSLFLLIASVTGAILSLEPVYEKSFGYDIDQADQITVSQLVSTLTSQYEELVRVAKDHNDFVQVTIFGDNGEETFYVNPFSGDRLGELIETPEVFNFSRTLHRSLFFGETGRFIVGVTSIFLLLISAAGFFLVLQKQGGLKAYFQKVVKEEFYRDYHTRLGKFAIFVIVIISLTGGFLFAERFSLVSQPKYEHTVVFEDLTEEPKMPVQHFPVFQSTNIGNLKEILFPFSEFVDDFYDLKLEDRELLVNQFTGEVVSQYSYGATTQLSSLSFTLHTAEGQPWWAILLGFTSVSMLFFMFSGLKIYLQRAAERTKIHNPIKKEAAEWIIAFGSETGATLLYAQGLHEALLDKGIKSFLVEMNSFAGFKNLQKLLVVTSTYGVGGPPSNARQFFTRLEGIENRDFEYAVLGFGSRKYPDFCQFAIDVNRKLSEVTRGAEVLDLKLIDNRDYKDFEAWVRKLEGVAGAQLVVKPKEKKRKLVQLEVIEKTFSKNSSDNTFLLELGLKQGSNLKCISGDLLVYRPSAEAVDRQYSMSVNASKTRILLSIKRHPDGLVSNLLSKLDVKDPLEVSFQENKQFHFDHKSAETLMIANGTGIAPFLGMIQSNLRKAPVHLFWGGQNDASFELYRPTLENLQKLGLLTSVKVAFSRTNEKQYVQDLLVEEETRVAECLQKDGQIMICGSLKMQQGVESVLGKIVERQLEHALDYYRESGQIKADCY
ncbi:MAG: PepSY domain-containing protein [Bacteroidota bacterium]